MTGTLHLTQHHLIFSHNPPAPEQPLSQGAKPLRPRELWITYPIISFCTLRPSPVQNPPSTIRLRCRDFTFVCFYFYGEKDSREREAREVYETIRSYTCKIRRIEKLYAFSYQPPGPEKEINGWKHYDARAEFRRMGVGNETKPCGWRLSKINSNYNVISPLKSYHEG